MNISLISIILNWWCVLFFKHILCFVYNCRGTMCWSLLLLLYNFIKISGFKWKN